MADPDLQISGGTVGGGGGGPDPEIRGAVSKPFFFRLFGSQFGLKIRAWQGPSPGSTTEKVGDQRCESRK